MPDHPAGEYDLKIEEQRTQQEKYRAEVARRWNSDDRSMVINWAIGAVVLVLVLCTLIVGITIGTNLGHQKANKAYTACVQKTDPTQIYVQCGSRP